MTPEGNFEGHNILNRLKDHRPREPATEARLAELRAKLLAVRERRVRPGLDDKVLADWNGLMIAALVNAGILFDEHAWIEIELKGLEYLDRQRDRCAGRQEHADRHIAKRHHKGEEEARRCGCGDGHELICHPEAAGGA